MLARLKTAVFATDHRAPPPCVPFARSHSLRPNLRRRQRSGGNGEQGCRGLGGCSKMATSAAVAPGLKYVQMVQVGGSDSDARSALTACKRCRPK